MPLTPIDISGADILKLPVKKADPPDGGLMLVPPPYEKCRHYNGPFELDEDAGECKCLQCGDKVTAVFVLKRLMQLESQWMQSRLAYQDEMKRLKERSQTKCVHCGLMTRISHR